MDNQVKQDTFPFGFKDILYANIHNFRKKP